MSGRSNSDRPTGLRNDDKSCLQVIGLTEPLATNFRFFEAHGFSGITRGLSGRAGVGNRPTIGLSEMGSVARVRDAARAATWANWKPGTLGVGAARRGAGRPG